MTLSVTIAQFDTLPLRQSLTQTNISAIASPSGQTIVITVFN
jgi:hypothetical protein